MDLRHMESFYQVAIAKSISAAASELNVSKSLLSRHIAALEQSLGAQLFHRTTRSIRLSDAGERLFARAEQIMILAQEARGDVQDWSRDVSGRLRFTCPMSLGDYILPDLIKTFSEACPQVQMDVHLSNEAFHIIDGDQDIAIRAGGDIHPDMVAKDMGWLRNGIAVSPDFLKLYGDMDSIEQLRETPAILFSHNQNWNEWRFVKDQQHIKMHVTGQVTVSHYSTALVLAKEGLGVVNLPLYLLEAAFKEGQLVPLFEDWIPVMHPVYILYAKHRRLPRKLQIFRDLILQFFQDNPRLLFKNE